MKPRFGVSLWFKALVWLSLHLLILTLAFVGFVRWQLDMGLDSLLSGAAGERLRIFGEAVREEIADMVPNQWNQAIKPLADEKNVIAVIFDPDFPDQLHFEIPENIIQRARVNLPPKRGPGPAGPPQGRRGAQPDVSRPHEGRLPHEGRGPQGDGPSRLAPDSSRAQPQVHPFGRVPAPRPVFLMRGDGGCGYWAGVHLVLPGGGGLRRPQKIGPEAKL